jgi:cell shape-determining protein MreD
MNKLGTFIVAYILLALELSLRPELMLAPSAGVGPAPFFLFPLVVFAALNAPISPALWTAALAGLAVDLAAVRPAGASAATGGTVAMATIGPSAVGFLVATYFVALLRGMIIKRSALAFAFTCVVSAIIAQIIIATLLLVRGMFDAQLAPTATLWLRMGDALYTALSALALFYAFRALSPILGMSDSGHRRFGDFPATMSSRR